jgi:Rod binding domain-containing protein
MSTLPPIDRLTLPADIRAASPLVQQQYAAGLLFEQELTKELTKQMSDDSSSLSGSPYASLLPDALADSITQAGGLGIARTLVDLPESTS